MDKGGKSGLRRMGVAGNTRLLPFWYNDYIIIPKRRDGLEPQRRVTVILLDVRIPRPNGPRIPWKKREQ